MAINQFMDQLTYLILLRFVHIVTGVFWAGATIYLAWFVAPAIKSLGADGGKFMQQLGNTNKLPLVMTIVSLLNIISGILLMWELSACFQSAWIFSRHGIIVTVGSLLALIAFLEGLFVTRPTVLLMNNLGKTIAKQGGPPSVQQAQQLENFRKKIFAATNLAAILLAASVIAMSLLRYL